MHRRRPKNIYNRRWFRDPFPSPVQTKRIEERMQNMSSSSTKFQRGSAAIEEAATAVASSLATDPPEPSAELYAVDDLTVLYSGFVIEDELLDHLATPEGAMRVWHERLSPELLPESEQGIRDALTFVIEYTDNYGEPPTPAVISEETGYCEFGSPRVPLEYVLDKLHERHKRNELRRVVSSAARLSNDPDAAIAYMAEEVASLAAPTRTSQQQDVAMSAYTATGVKWLIPNLVPLGGLTILTGTGGVGKSQLAVRFAAELSTGKLTGTPGATVLSSVEDVPEYTIRPRLEAVGADLDLIRNFAPSRSGMKMPPQFPDDLGKLYEIVRRRGDVKLVIIDPLMAHLGSEIDSYKDQSIRQVLSRLQMMAEEHELAVIIVNHKRKTNDGSAANAGSGSAAINNAARASFIMERDPEDDSRRLLASVKFNLGPEPSTRIYELEEVTLDSGITTSRLNQIGFSGITADQLQRKPKTGPTKAQRADDLLTEHLRDGPVAVSELKSIFAAEKISFDTAKDAKARLGAESRKQGKAWFWHLPDRE